MRLVEQRRRGRARGAGRRRASGAPLSATRAADDPGAAPDAAAREPERGAQRDRGRRAAAAPRRRARRSRPRAPARVGRLAAERTGARRSRRAARSDPRARALASTEPSRPQAHELRDRERVGRRARARARRRAARARSGGGARPLVRPRRSTALTPAAYASRSARVAGSSRASLRVGESTEAERAAPAVGRRGRRAPTTSAVRPRAARASHTICASRSCACAKPRPKQASRSLAARTWGTPWPSRRIASGASRPAHARAARRRRARARARSGGARARELARRRARRPRARRRAARQRDRRRRDAAAPRSPPTAPPQGKRAARCPHGGSAARRSRAARRRGAATATFERSQSRGQSEAMAHGDPRRHQRVRPHRPARAARGARGKDVEFVAVNDLTDAKTLAHLLKYDSVHGRFPGDGRGRRGRASWSTARRIKVLAEKDPAKLPWKELGVDVVIESHRPLHRPRQAPRKHLDGGRQEGASSRAPAKDADLTIVLGVNDDAYDPAKHHIISNALLHHQLPGAGRQGAARQLRHRARPDDHDPRLHQRPEHPRPPAQGPAPRARRRAAR